MRPLATHNLLTIMMFCLLTGSSMQTAHAVQSINTQTFNPSVSDHFVLMEDGLMTEWPKMSKYYFGMNYNYVNDPFVATDISQANLVQTLIDSIQTFDTFIGYRPTKQMGLYLALPIHTVTYDPNQTILTGASGSHTVMGDMKIMGKFRLNKVDSDTAWAIIPEFHLPTGSTEHFVSDASTYFGARLALERTFKKWTLGVNLGLASAPNAKYSTIDLSKRLLFSVGGFVPFDDHWGMSIEFQTLEPLPFSTTTHPNELYAGLRYASSDNLVWTAGASLGKLSGATGQNYRAIIGLRYTWFDESTVDAPYIHPAPAPMPVAAPAPAPTQLASVLPKAILRAKRIELLMPVNFELNSDKLAADASGILNDVADIMKRNPKAYKKIIVDGHTDKIGTDKYNLNLSIRRARSVRTYLISQGIPSNQLEARGFGERRAKVPYTEPRAHEINRRVEFIVVK